MTGFWQLPAPASFLRRISEDVREGNVVVVAIPDHTPDGWPAALRASLALPSLPRVEEFQPNGSTPMQALHEHLNLGPCSPHASVSDLCANGGFHARLIHLRQFNPATWSSWSAFLNEYEDACRQFDLSQRTLFIATIHGDLAARAPRPANLLRVHRWMDSVDGLNARLYAANLLSSSTLPHWQRQLAVATLSELALWDPEVMTLGASKPLVEILSPGGWLAALAIARGWSPTDDLRSPLARWRGWRQPFEGQLRTHSAWLAMANRTKGLAHRLWAGQISVLFPLLERHRRAILSRYGALLRVPWHTQFVTVLYPEELELNHIADQLRIQGSGGLRQLCDFACWLRDIRNSLAHLTPVDPQYLLDKRFEEIMGNLTVGDDD